MISVYWWNAELKLGQWLDAEVLTTRAEELRCSPGVVWIDLEAPSVDEESLVYQQFCPIHPLTLEDVTKQRREPEGGPHFPKAEEFSDYLFVVVNPLAPCYLDWLQGRTQLKGGHDASTQLSAVLTEHTLITHHYHILFGVEQLRRYLTKHQTQADRGPDFLFHLILDNLVDQVAPVLDFVDETLNDIEGSVFKRPGQEALHRLVELKRQIVTLRKTLVYEREVVARLARGEFELIDEREMVYYRNVFDHLVRFSELAEESRDKAGDLMQTQLGAASNRLNEIMKVLTMISTVTLPMTLIAGIYGMNFTKNVWPHFEESEWGFLGAILAMLATGAAALVLFRWNRWI